MKDFFKKHVGLIIIIAIAIAFPASLSTQTRLNMRIIVTGFAIDKNDDKYKVTAQIIKTSQNDKSGGNSATINFISDEGNTIIAAVSKLSYLTGKTASFSHTNYIVIGNNMLEEDLSSTLDYFMRDTLIKNSILVLIAEGKAEDEIKKTKDIELSVGIGLQKVFLYKQKEGDGVMTTLLDFMKNSTNNSKTAVASVLKIEKEKDSLEDKESSSSQQGEKSTNQYFKSQTPLVCFVDGKLAGKIENEEELFGYMFANQKATLEDISLENITYEKLKNAKVGVKIKSKKVNKKIRYENNIPCLDIVVNITNSEIQEIENNELIALVSDVEFQKIKDELKDSICKKVGKCFETTKGFGADVFGAYEMANKYKYNDTNRYYQDMQSFMDNLKLNVSVNINRLEY